MLDIRFIRENVELVKKSSERKGYKVDIDKLLELDKNAKEKLAELQPLREERNKLAEASKGARPTDDQIEEGKRIREKVVSLEAELGQIIKELEPLQREVPNIIPDDTPVGGEEANAELKKWGETNDRDFDVKDHLSWAEERGLIDFERGAKVAGNKFYYLKSGLVELELAILNFGIQFARENGFWPMTVPHMVNTKTLEGAGFSAKGNEKQIYKVEEEDLNMIATAEIPLTGFFADEIIPTDWLPSKMVAWSPSYRVEGGAYGRYNRGLYRVHQFNKLEMYVYSKPDQSEDLHNQLLELEEKFCQALNLPYRVVRIAAGDLGAPAYKKYDVEYWSPADKSYRELMSCSNVTDYQARRLNIRFKEGENTQFVHTLNATLAATSRLLIAIIENFQDKEGKVNIPPVLQKYMNDQVHL